MLHVAWPLPAGPWREDWGALGRADVIVVTRRRAAVAESRALAGRIAARWPEAFVPDVQGSGTTLYTAAPGAAFRPGFGLDSRRRHAEGGAAELLLPGITGLRQDVDTPEDLRAAARLGLGPRTAALAAELLRAAG